jgi:hypothetical protein
MSDGSVVRGPATAPQPSFEVRVVGNRVQIPRHLVLQRQLRRVVAC